MQDDYKNYGRRKHDRQGILIGMVGVLGLMVLIYATGDGKNMDMKPLPSHVTCKCHAPEQIRIKTSKHYQRFHRHPNVEDRKLAQEMEQNEYIVSVLMGAKP